MKKTFTRFMAALALLFSLCIPLGMWGQGNYSATYTSNCTLTAGTNGSDCTIYVGTEDYSGIKVGTSSKGGDMSVTVPAGAKYLHIHVAAWNGVNGLSLNITPNGNVTPTSVALTANSGIANNSPFTFSGNPYTSDYYKVITFAEALTSETVLTFTTSIAKRFVIWGVNAEAVAPTPPPTGPTCTIDPTAWDFGNVQAGSASQTKQFDVTTADLTGDLTVELLEGDYYSVDVATIGQNETSKTITVTLNPTIVGSMEDVLMITGGGIADVEVDLTATGLCNNPTNALAYPTPGDQILENGAVSYALNPTANTGNGGAITYMLTTNPGGNGEIINNNTFYAIGIGQYVVHAEQALNGTTCGGSADITINVFGPTKTITFDAGSGTCTTPSITQNEGKTITLPTATPSEACVSKGWTFVGWAASEVSETTTAPTLLSGEYTITGNATLYAVYKVTEGDGGSFEYDFSQQGYTNAQIVYNAVMDATSGIGWAATKGTNDPAYYDTGNGLRIYNGGTFKVTANNKTITAVSLTFAGDSYTFNSNDENPTTWSGSQATDITWNVGQTCRLQKVNVTYGLSTTTYNSNPDCLEQVATPTFSLEEGTYIGAKNVTISCTTDGATILYKTSEEGQWQTYSAAIPVSTTTTIWAKATKDGMDDSDEAEATYTIQYTLTAAMTNVAEFTVSVGGDLIDLTNNQAPITAGATVSVNLTIEDCYVLNSLTVNSSTEGVTEESGVYSFVMPEGNATVGVSTTQKTEYTLTVVGGENVTFDMFAGSGDTPISLNNNTVSICEQLPVRIANLTAISGHFIESVALTEGGASTTLTPEGGVYSFTMPSENATLTFTTGSAPTYTLANSIISGKSYIIVGFNGNNAYAMGEQKTNNRAGVGITVHGTTATGNADVHEVVITAIGNDMYTIEDGGYLYASSSSKNYLNTESTLDDNGKWTIVIGNDGEASIVAQGDYTHKYMRFNINNNSPIFSCYLSTSELPKVYLYVKNETHELTINPYNPEATTANGWYLIASPVYTTPSQVGNLIGEQISTNPVSYNYDLYRFNQATTSAEWENYHQHTGDFNIVPGQGYLYAKSTGTTLTFTGAPYNGNGVISLNYSEANSNSNMWGWNLIGNPFAVTANLPGGFSYYTLNGNRDDLIPSSANTINAMEAIFVKATAEDQSVTFTKQSRNAEGNANAVMALNLSSNSNGLIDRTIVRFDEGSTLPKFMFNESHTKIYIPQNGEDYAVVCGEAQGEMPINFKAMEDGQYTISMEPEGVEVGYLHLIDNIAGQDIDLIATPSYTFNAKGDDYESRFRLVFSANMTNAEMGEDFAFISNGQLVIANEGEATLQVIDVTGRVVATENINGTCSKAINAKAGVYVLRLINGIDVKTQKIVIR